MLKAKFHTRSEAKCAYPTSVFCRMAKLFYKLVRTLDQLKYNKRALLWIMALDLALAISSNVVDWPWLIRVPPALVIFAPICSLYPTLLLIWFALYYVGKTPPPWFTAFIFMGIVSYGFMAQIYFPFYMSWNGINFHDIGSMFWVALYGMQSLIIASEIKKLPIYQYILIFGYFFFKDYSDRYLGTFLDILLDSYPENLKLFLSITIVVIHIATASLVIYLGRKRREHLLTPETHPLKPRSSPLP